jgi:hypothetical protein
MGPLVLFRAVMEALLVAFGTTECRPVDRLAGFAPHLGRVVPGWGGGSTESWPLPVGEAVVGLLRVRGPGWVGGREDLQGGRRRHPGRCRVLAAALRAEAGLCVVTARDPRSSQGCARRGATVVARGPLAAAETPTDAAALDRAPDIRVCA